MSSSVAVDDFPLALGASLFLADDRASRLIFVGIGVSTTACLGSRRLCFCFTICVQTHDLRRSTGGRGFDSQRGQKDFFFTSCGSLIPFTRANAQWVIHGLNKHLNLHFRVNSLFHH